MFEKITKTLSGLAFIKYINSLIDYVNTSDIDATRIKGQLDISNIPPAGLDNVIKVDTVTDMLALTVDDVQNGDTVMIIGVTPSVQYQVVDDTKLGTMDAFQEYAAGTATKALADINGNNIHTTYGKLAGNNTWTGNNYWNGSAIFNANLNIRGSATTPGDTSVYLWLGLKPEGSEKGPCIARNKTGELMMYAADYRHCFLKSGIQTSFASVCNSDGTVLFSSLNTTPWGKYTKANGLELTVHKTPTVNNDVPNKKYVDDSIANGDVNSAKYLNITNFIPSNSDFNDYKTPGEYQVQSNTEANTIANLPTSYNDATPRGGVLSVLIGFNAPRTSLVQIYRTYGSSYVVSRTYQRCFYHENSSWTAWREIACTDEVGLLNQANTYTALNTFRANIAVSNGTEAGSQGQIVLGVKPRTATVQANIISSTTGALNYIATENTGHYFKIGNNTASTSITTNESGTAILSHNAFEFARITNVGVAKWLGNANTATKLATARTINGVSFDGTANITIADSTKLPITGGTMTGDLTLKGNPTTDLMAATKKYVDDSIASVGDGDVLAAGNNSFTGANTFQNLVTMVGGAAFTSGTTTLAWKNATQIIATINASTYTGNSATATKLKTARTINGVSFDGTANITIADSTKLPITGGTMTGDLTLKGNPTTDLMAATKKYVDDSIASVGDGDVLAAGNNSFTGANTFQNLVTMVGGAAFTSGTTTLAWKNATQIIATINASTYTGNSATATKLKTARTITANLASSTAGSFDGSANITVGVTGTLPIANGGTGLTSAPSMLVNLASTTATSPLQASPRPGVTGTLPIANGGTGQTTAAGVRNALGLGNTTGAVPIANGGTGATTAAAARTALGCAPAYTYSTTDLTAGSSALTTGTLYIVYE